MVKNVPSNAGDTGPLPGLGTKILHAAEQLSLWAMTRESMSHNKELVLFLLKIDNEWTDGWMDVC